MSKLPASDFLSGYLPPGIHPADHEEIRQRFVAPSEDPLDWGSVQRETIFAGYEKLVAALQLVGIEAEQWIGGSFVTEYAEPNDIDLVNYCDAKAFEGLAAESRALIKQYFKGAKTAEHCHCDSYFVPLPPEAHQQSEDFEIIIAYWKKKLGHDKIGRPKGIVSRLVELEPVTPGAEEVIDEPAT